MDRDQEKLQFLGFFGIFKESFKIIFTWRKIFSQITLTLILPLAFTFLANMHVSELLFVKILINYAKLHDTQVGTPSYADLSDIISSEWSAFGLFKIAYFTFFLILSPLSTSAVVYTVACIYTAKPVTFNKIMTVMPKVWKRLIITFLWSFAIVLVYNLIAIVVVLFMCFVSLFMWYLFHNTRPEELGNPNFLVLLLVNLGTVYFIGLLYITIVWLLACVISVLEDVYGISAMIKSKNLIKGKMGLAVAVFIVIGICLVDIRFLFDIFVGFEWPIGIRVGVGSLCFLLLFNVVVLFGLVIQTVLYFVCKSYHHENIDKSSLAEHLEVYVGDHVPLKSEDVQMEQVEV